MKSLVITLFLCVLSAQIGKAQASLSDYNYIVVPDQFEFLKGKDQHQVNSLTTWLLNKNGFNAYLDSQLPLYLRKLPCRGLKAVVVAKENFLVLKTTVVITNCEGTVLYTSDEGRSKDKDYRKSYHEAIRGSFESITTLGVNQIKLTEEEVKPEPMITAVKDVKEDSGGISSGGTPTLAIKEVDDTSEGISSGGKEQAAVAMASEVTEGAAEAVLTELTKLTFKDYTLVAAQNSFDVLYKGAKIGTAKPTSNKDVFLVSTSQFSGVGYPTAQGFVIEREIEGMDEIVKMTFTRE
ncbi:MAG: hypothetical protein ABJM06_03380 [Gilvibacter sp.]|uniref:hypothetical protein n=1 Tax=Nonlabens ulvanivorans TaxID=906888 RepID=UPI003297E3F9